MEVLRDRIVRNPTFAIPRVIFVVDITNCWWWNILAKLVLLRLPWNLLVFVLKYPSVMRHRSISEGVQRWRRISRYTVCQPYGRLVHFDGHDFTPMKKRVITGLGGYFSSTLLFYSRPWGSYSSLQVFTAYPGLKLIAYLFARLSNRCDHNVKLSFTFIHFHMRAKLCVFV